MNPMGMFAWAFVGTLIAMWSILVLKTQINPLVEVIVGLIGAFFGGIVWNQIAPPPTDGFNPWSLALAGISALAMVTFLRLAVGKVDNAAKSQTANHYKYEGW